MGSPLAEVLEPQAPRNLSVVALPRSVDVLLSFDSDNSTPRSHSSSVRVSRNKDTTAILHGRLSSVEMLDATAAGC